VSGKNKRYGGFLFAEILTALTVLGILLVGLALSLNGFAKANRHQLIKQRCIAAAQSQLDSIAVIGKPIPAEDFRRLWPKLDVSIRTSEGFGQWEGMKLVEVTTSGSSFRNQVKVTLSRYVLGDPVLHYDVKRDSVAEGGR
jgi:hypothetical protein